jgi:ankyrin repeat protein
VSRILVLSWFSAIRDGDSIRIKELIEQGIDINIQTGFIGTGSNSNTALIIATNRGYLKIVDLLLSQPNINVNIQNSNKYTALIVAAMKNNLDLVKKFLNVENVDITLKDEFNKTFVDYLNNKY